MATPAARVTRALDHLPPAGLALGGIASLQCGAALATRLFPAVGVTGAVTLRLSFAAIMLLLRPGGHLSWAGVLFACIAGACWACYITASATLTRRVGDSRNLAPAMAWAALICLPFGIISAGSALLRPASLLTGLAVSLLASAVSYSLQMDALRRMPRRLFAILTSTEPAMAAIIGWLALGQQPAPLESLGIAAIVAAPAGAAWTAR